MKIWLTAPYDPAGIEEAEVTDDSTDASLVFIGGPKAGGWSQYWYREGLTWHRTKEAAVKAAQIYRAKWIKETTEEAAKIASLPAIAA